MEKLSNAVLFTLFATVILGSFQPVFSDDVTDRFEILPIKNSEYQFHVQGVHRDVDSNLISLIESTSGYYVHHEITNQAFDNCFGSDICKKEIVTIEDKNYEKIQFTIEHKQAHTLFMLYIMAELSVTDNNKIVIVDAPILQAFIPLTYMAEGDVIYAQWTVLRTIN